jgi:hypothetical protein
MKISVTSKSIDVNSTYMFAHSSVECDASSPFSTTTQSSYYTEAHVFENSSTEIDFSGKAQGTYRLCVKDKNTSSVYAIPSATLEVTAPIVVGVAGDPHVRSATGKWLDFYGETGVYTLLDGNMQANAKFGYAIRDNFMIWHPKVMRPGTLVEEVGIRLQDDETSLRLGTQAGGIVSVRTGLKSADFWTSSSGDRSLHVGDYSITWSKCTANCEAAMPWGTHQRTHSLTIRGRGEYLELFVTSSGGYRFIDVEAMPSQGATGLLADASAAPEELAERLLSGGERSYQVEMLQLSP